MRTSFFLQRTQPAASTPPLTAQASATSQQSPWHSPIPYLFGGLAAMMGLIAFALLTLACSYWRLWNNNNRRRVDGEFTDGSDVDQEQGKPVEGETKLSPATFEQKFLVILAGNAEPTCLATPKAAALVVVAQRKEREEEQQGECVDHDDKTQDERPRSSESQQEDKGPRSTTTTITTE